MVSTLVGICKLKYKKARSIPQIITYEYIIKSVIIIKQYIQKNYNNIYLLV